jgi:hypothetical protein
MMTGNELDQVFILRFWRERPSADEEPIWRARVRHVNDRQQQTASNVDAALALVAAKLAAALAVEREPHE